MSEGPLLEDARDRLLAETTWDRNVVVVAGAGTGKTTLLVNRMLNLLLREPQPLAITEIVALTFTNKAATEMKQRLRRELTALAEEAPDSLCMLFRSRYQLTTEDVASRAASALEQLEKAQIGTLHSFAAHLLRLHPVESGCDPSFQEDDGSQFMEWFQMRWDAWLAEELGTAGSRHDRWRRVLRQVDVQQLQELARLLAAESIDLNELERQCASSELGEGLRQWVERLHLSASRLLTGRMNAKPVKIDQMLAAAHRLFERLLEQGPEAIQQLPREDQALLAKDIGKATAGWTAADFAEARAALTVAQQLLTVDQMFVRELIGLLRPFVATLHRAYETSGWVTFDGLLVRAKRLLRDHPTVRARLKRSYRAILVDEFQDTDPIQYEIILYLAEREGVAHQSWEELDLEPGKLFIVGDPKQSIYAFRRADIEAFQRVLDRILAGGGVAYSLRTNFRSDGAVLSVVNDVFDRLFQAHPHLQPANERLTARPRRTAELPSPGVQMRLAAGDDEEDFDTAAATRAEAEGLARWIKQTLLAETVLVDQGGRGSPLQPGHIALIFRKLTQAQDYLDALRRYGVAYLTDGEKHFYRRQEIIDLVNVLRTIENPHDVIALVGLLRSPLGGVSDQDILRLRRAGGLHMAHPTTLPNWSSEQAAVLRSLYARLTDLHQVAPRLPLPEVLTLVFERLPLLELAAASRHGEQAVANLLKARGLAEELADRAHLTLSGFIELMVQRLLDQPEEAESALAEPSLEAVRILTIHKAKGLEFPVVILPGLHQGTKPSRSDPAILHDWSSRCYGISTGTTRSLGSVLVAAKVAAREEAEQRRLLYVGMTRARDLLVLSGGLPRRAGRDTVWGILQQAMGEEVLSPSNAELELGTGRIARIVSPASMGTRGHPQKAVPIVPTPALRPLLERHQRRRDQWSHYRGTPITLTPSRLQQAARGTIPFAPRTATRPDHGTTVGQAIGICAHALLERWDFSRSDAPSSAEIDVLCRRLLSADTSDMSDMSVVQDDLTTLFKTFFSSDAYRTLQRAQILSRETPFAIPWGQGQVMEGVIDLLYRLDDIIWVADYKTDLIEGHTVESHAEQYRTQVEIYREAVRQSLRVTEVRAQLVFLRTGQIVSQ